MLFSVQVGAIFFAIAPTFKSNRPKTFMKRQQQRQKHGQHDAFPLATRGAGNQSERALPGVGCDVTETINSNGRRKTSHIVWEAA